MPTLSRRDYPTTQGGRHRVYTEEEIARQRLLNDLDRQVAHEGARRLRLSLGSQPVTIEYYGDQLGPDAYAIVTIGHRAIKIALAAGVPVPIHIPSRRVKV
jgi:hypothetical protein